MDHNQADDHHMAEADDVGASEPSALRPRLRNRQACESCRRAKVKCDGNGPCVRCTKRSMANSCSNMFRILREARSESQDVISVGPADPVEFQARGHDTFQAALLQSAAHDTHFRTAGGAGGLDIPFGERCLLWEYQHLGETTNLLNNMTPALQEAVATVLSSVDRIGGRLLEKQGRGIQPEPEDVLESSSRRGESIHAGFFSISFDADSDAQSLRLGSGELRRAVSVHRHSTVIVNQVMASVLGGEDCTQVIDRINMNNMVSPLTEFRLLCKILDELMNFGLPTLTRFCRWDSSVLTEPAGATGGLLVRETTRWAYDEAGRRVQKKVSFVVVSPDEYDRSKAQDPLSCSPFMGEIGDDRSGLELLNAENLRLKETMSRMLHSAQGRHTQDMLASVLTTRIHRLFSEASRR